ncbi:hypothetical protein IV203_036808 [Nitzschia inconspicua]|uniref:Uncharacterized protein n=1 Tax=Nitzschia inconspicua TaxID=303405 RepID=A0A9K3PVW5_9STRA|nr:hypothetical protein IV203_036808 [Nitzschia inconspicua]
MTRSTSRPRRGTTKKSVLSDFHEGDIVEIDRGHGTIVRGRLVQLLTKQMSSTPRWLVTFDDQPYKDEEMYEQAFGELLYSAWVNEENHINDQPDDDDDVAEKYGGTFNGSKRSIAVKVRVINGSGTSSESEKSAAAAAAAAANKTSSTKRSKSKKKSVQFEHATADRVKVVVSSGGADDDDDDDNEDRSGLAGRRNSSKASAREQRSKRRQSKIDEDTDVMFPGSDVLVDGNKRKFSSTTTPGPAVKKQKHNTAEADGEVVVVTVKLLTGTLYFYRGAQRRVEFLRRI